MIEYTVLIERAMRDGCKQCYWYFTKGERMLPRENRNCNGRLLRMPELQEYLNMGTKGAAEFAGKAGAVFKIGNRVLYDRAKIDAYIDAKMEEQQAQQ